MNMMCGEKTVLVPADPPEDADGRYALVAGQLGDALARLAAGYEADPSERQDLLQNIHFQLWRSLKAYDGRCGLRSWAYRVAHNVAADHVRRARRWHGMVGLDEIPDEAAPDPRPTPEAELSERQALIRIHAILRSLKPIDRQVMLLYLEDESAVTIAEVSGLSPAAVATRVHRVKRLMAERFRREAV